MSGQQLVKVYLTNAVRTSQGPGDKAMVLPADEAADLVKRKVAVYGDRPPRGYLDGGGPAPVTAASN